MELVFFGVILPAVFGVLGYLLLKHGVTIADSTSLFGMDWSRRDNLLGVWAGGLLLVVMAVVFAGRVLYKVLFE